MKKSYVYKSIALHIAVVLLCVFEVPFLNGKRKFEEQPPILIDLADITISDTTNLPEKAVFGKEKKPATRKEKPAEGNYTPKTQEPEPKAEPIKEEPKPEPKIEAPEIKAPTLIEEAPQTKDEPKKETPKPIKEKKKAAPIPQKKPQIKPKKKPEPVKKPEPKKAQPAKPAPAKKTPAKSAIRATNPLASLMNSVDDLQKQIGEEDAPAQITEETQVNNMGVEGGNSKGSYFSELSVSGIDFVRSKIQESWKTIAGGKDDRNIEVVINVKLTKDGGIISVDVENSSRYRSDPYFQALADSAERAIHIANSSFNVFKVLADQNGSRYNDWKDIRFSFTPLGVK